MKNEMALVEHRNQFDFASDQLPIRMAVDYL